MSDPIWGNLQKSLDDPQTIDQAIAAAIAAHEEDPTAHLGDGESLQQHKSNDIIDHPAGSVKNDKGSFSIFDYQNYFSDFSEWGNTGDFGQNAGGSVIFQTALTSTEKSLWREFDVSFLRMQDDYSKVFAIEGMFSAFGWNSNDKIRFGFGAFGINDGWFVGFEVVGNKLYTCIPNTSGVVQKHEIVGFNPLDASQHSYYFRYDATERMAYWYIDNVLVYSINVNTNNLSTNTDPFPLMTVLLVGMGAYDTEFYFFNPRFSVDYTY